VTGRLGPTHRTRMTGPARPSSRVPPWPALGLPAHRASSATLATAYPFLVPGPLDAGVPIGVDALSGSVFCFDPWTAYRAGDLTNPNVVLAGVVGAGKSALAKSLAFRSIAAGRRVYVPGDPKGEWSTLAHAVGGVVIDLGPGCPTRLNPLDSSTPGPDGHGDRLRRLSVIAATTLHRDLRPHEHSALDAAVETAERAPTPTVAAVVAALTRPDPRAARRDAISEGDRANDGRDLAHGLRRLVHGDLAGMFDGPTTRSLDLAAPIVVLDLSRIGADDDALAVAMTCTSGWLDSALSGSASAHRWVIYDEAWRLLRHLAVVRRLQAQWKLARAAGIANLLIVHRLSDLDAVGSVGSEARTLAEGLLADCSTRIVYRQEADQLPATGAALGLTGPERDLLPSLPRGTGLWKLPRRTHVVHHLLHPTEAALVDTDQAMHDELPAGPVH